MPFSQWIPLAPAGLLLLGALLIPATDLMPAIHHRRWLTGGVAVAVLLCELVVHWAGDGPTGNTIVVPWLDEAGLSLRLTSPYPLEWVILVSVAGAALTMRQRSGSTAIGAASLFLSAAFGLLVTKASDARTLALCGLAFDVAVTVLLLALRHRQLALARLLLGVAQATALMAVSDHSVVLGADHVAGAVFCVLVWVRIGLYPLVEADQIESGEMAPLTLGWHAVQLAVGLYLAQTGLPSWLLWPVVGTTMLHGALAWLAKNRETCMVYAVYTLAGTALAGLALGAQPDTAPAAGAVLAGALLAVTLAGSRATSLVGVRVSRDWLRLANYLPLLLSTISLAGLPQTLGFATWGQAFALTWGKASPITTAALIMAQGAGLSVLVRYWRPAWQVRDGEPIVAVRLISGTLVAVPFLVPILGPYWWTASTAGADALSAATSGAGTWIGLGVAVLWAVFLGAGQPVMLRRVFFRRGALCHWLRLEPAFAVGLRVFSFCGTLLLRLRVVFEGEHYLGWAILLLSLGLLLALVHGPTVLR